MDLPIDHFRLLGVSPSAQADAILRRLQSRCDSPPDQGFTHEVIVQRETLLRRSADLLTDAAARAEYEAALLALSESHPNETVGLDLSASNEVAGLILLWEAGAAQEAFQLARQGLQPPQAPALGSGRESDLTLVAALACRAAAEAEQQQRRYESAAQLLRDGIELQQRMGKLPDQEALLERELKSLLPFRILDLLSRDLSAVSDHDQGIALLDALVRERGGLEGQLSLADSSAMTQADFESFFQQIRCFLTVQEQIDLFSSWQAEGSGEAGFLAVFALTAAGFSRRKPELIEQAREQVQRLSTIDLDPMPLLGCLDLLLGNVAEAANHFRSIRDPELLRWLSDHPGDDLAAQCEYCRVWLERDVMPGHRDVDPAGVDLDAWFADRDVQAYVDRLDRQSASSGEAPTSGLTSSGLTSSGVSTGGITIGGMSFPSEWLGSADPAPSDRDELRVGANSEDDDQATQTTRQWRPWALGAAGLALLSALVFAVQRNSNQPPKPEQRPSLEQPSSELIPPPQKPSAEKPSPAQPQANLRSETTAPGTALAPLVADKPDEQQLRALIQGWLDSKARALQGQPSDLPVVARPRLIERVDQERAVDVAAGNTTVVEASVTALDVVSRQPRRIELKAEVAYSDSTTNGSGAVVRRTKPGSLSITYILGRDGDQWRLTAYIPQG